MGIIKSLDFRKATPEDIPAIWEILQHSIARRKNDGSTQWQDGYPNLSTVESDVKKAQNYVLTQNGKLVLTGVIIFNDEPTYKEIDGAWLTNEEFLVVHRIGVSNEASGQGLAKTFLIMAEMVALKNNIFSLKIDTNFDNIPMLKTLEKLGYTYCGEIQVRDGKRKAFEKVLTPS